MITAAFLRNYTMPVEEESEEEEGGLRKEGIAGIVVASVVAFLFILGMIVSFKGWAWVKSFFKCCKNKTQSLPIESPRNAELERRETGLAGSAGEAIGHQPPSSSGSMLPSGSKDTLRVIPQAHDEILGASVGGDLNSTGQQLLSNAKHSHEEGPPIVSYHSNDASTDKPLLSGATSAQGMLPNIHHDNAAAARGFNDAELPNSGRLKIDDDFVRGDDEL